MKGGCSIHKVQCALPLKATRKHLQIIVACDLFRCLNLQYESYRKFVLRRHLSSNIISNSIVGHHQHTHGVLDNVLRHSSATRATQIYLCDRSADVCVTLRQVSSDARQLPMTHTLYTRSCPIPFFLGLGFRACATMNHGSRTPPPLSSQVWRCMNHLNLSSWLRFLSSHSHDLRGSMHRADHIQLAGRRCLPCHHPQNMNLITQLTSCHRSYDCI